MDQADLASVGTIIRIIEIAKHKCKDIQYVEEELKPLWGLPADSLVQIIAAVGLLLYGVLVLAGKLLNALSLGGLVNDLLGGLDLNNFLRGLCLGGDVDAVVG